MAARPQISDQRNAVLYSLTSSIVLPLRHLLSVVLSHVHLTNDLELINNLICFKNLHHYLQPIIIESIICELYFN